MPEPATAAAERRDHKVIARFSPQEDDLLRAGSRTAGRSLSAHLRHLLICARTETSWHRDLPIPLRIQLERLGINLRQLRELDAEPRLHAEIVRVHERVSGRLWEDIRAWQRSRVAQDGEADVPHPAAEPGELKSQAHGKRTVLRDARVSGNELEVIEALADQAEMSVSDYARAVLPDGHIVIHKRRALEASPDPEPFREQGQMLNRLTQAANAEGRVCERVLPLLSAIDTLMDRVPGGALP